MRWINRHGPEQEQAGPVLVSIIDYTNVKLTCLAFVRSKNRGSGSGGGNPSSRVFRFWVHDSVSIEYVLVSPHNI